MPQTGGWQKIKLSTCTICQRIPVTFGLFCFFGGRLSRGSPLPVLVMDKPVKIKEKTSKIYDRYSEWERSFGMVASNSSLDTLERLRSSLQILYRDYQLDDSCWKGAIQELSFVYVLYVCTLHANVGYVCIVIMYKHIMPDCNPTLLAVFRQFPNFNAFHGPGIATPKSSNSRQHQVLHHAGDPGSR